MIVDIQRACEVLEEMLQKNIRSGLFLTASEFIALNKVLFELASESKYEVVEE